MLKRSAPIPNAPRARRTERCTEVMMRLLARLTLVALAGVAGMSTHSAERSVPIPGGNIESVLPPAPGVKVAAVPAFRLDAALVSNADFAQFVHAKPEWRRDRIAGL